MANTLKDLEAAAGKAVDTLASDVKTVEADVKPNTGEAITVALIILGIGFGIGQVVAAIFHI